MRAAILENVRLIQSPSRFDEDVRYLMDLSPPRSIQAQIPNLRCNESCSNGIIYSEV